MEFYFNDNEIKNLFEFLMSIEGKLIPDLLYEDSNYRILRNYEDFDSILKYQTVHFFLISDSFQIERLLVTENRYIKGGNKYGINQRKGGPYIDLFFYRGFSEDATVKYKRSEIDIYGKFIHVNSSQEFKATEELTVYYKLIVDYIRKRSKRIKIGTKKHYIGFELLNDKEFLEQNNIMIM
ncbi:hypothetical protein [Sphingobacterium sp. UBA2074]|uniref:hypothetical protein n=1 Tax=Sphingobacterium sp. UBA2074 TaxID=1947487 RepID=UPI00257D35EF|nr:hypothetical protein [Sphingobacterium sp. UBA2074]